MMATRGSQADGIAVIGCGHWGRNYLRVLTALGGRPLCCTDEDAKCREEIRGLYPNIDVEPDLDAILSRDDIGAVVIATTASTHFEIARRCLPEGRDLHV